MNGEWTIRKASENDLQCIADFNVSMAYETEKKELDPAVVVAGVRRLFLQPDMGFYIVGEHERKVCGTLMITFEWTDWRNGLFWWIQSVYVDPAFRRKGLFRALYDRVITLAAAHHDVRGIRLYVEKDNLAARKTYTSLGMVETHYRLFECELP